MTLRLVLAVVLLGVVLEATQGARLPPFLRRPAASVGNAVCSHCIFETTFPSATCPDMDSCPAGTGIGGGPTSCVGSGGWGGGASEDARICAVGDRMHSYGNWTLGDGSAPYGDQIRASFNFGGGNGGKAFRHYRGNGFDQNGGGFKVLLAANEPEVWIRFYMRYAAGFSWTNNTPGFTKDIYLIDGTATNNTFGFEGGGMWGWTSTGGTHDTGTIGWATIADGSGLGTGLYNCYEYHIKAGGAGVGIKQYWVDGVQGMNNTTTAISSATGGGWEKFVFGHNQSDPTGGTLYTDYDDIAISTTGRIGCPWPGGA